MKKSLVLAVLGMLTLAGPAAAGTIIHTFDVVLESFDACGVGEACTDGFGVGHPYDSSLGVPTVGEGDVFDVDFFDDNAIDYVGSPSAADFHLMFNMPFEVNFDFEGASAVQQFTHLDSDLGEVFWTLHYTTTELWFTAPAGVQLDYGEMFEINIALLFADAGQLEVTGAWTAVPEPATLLLLGTGLGAVAAGRRLKKRA